MRAYPGCLYKP